MSTPTIATVPASIMCDCGHESQPTIFVSGFAVHQVTAQTLCYQCAADKDKDKARTMRPGDPPLFAYIKGELPAPHSRVRNQVVTWAGITLGTAQVIRGAKHQSQLHIIATIAGRKFWGKSPASNGTYVRLHPYADQNRSY